ncbi:HEAT repeat domain-containing protein [Candidatus Methanocrinis natronophilus]|uniref:HEAT repeat domain-containing protein n=1 Tax=Candidatus Methanocrinis natronophilus TaxID=3033396 RepID=UPI00374405F2
MGRYEEAIDPLIKALQDQNAMVRPGATRSLGDIGDARASDALTYLASNDENADVRSIPLGR